MKINSLSQEELDSMSYDEIAFLLLNESSSAMKITDLFKKVCDLLHLSEDVYEAKIADFFQLLSTDKRFIMLEKGFWDLSSRHESNVIMDTEEDGEEDTSTEEENEEETTEEDTDIFYDDTDDVDDEEDDLQDLVIVSDDQDEENTNM